LAHKFEITILIPCLDEQETIGACISNANRFLNGACVEGEILVADNGSRDRSVEIAREMGARVVSVGEKGYGNALMGGINAANGQYIIMGDADGSYDFLHLDPFLAELRSGCDLVVGNRFRGGIEPNAMPRANRYFGNPLLTFIGRLLYGCPVGDIYCGLRGFRRQAIVDLDLRARGMEFAVEMAVKASLAGLNIDEVPTTLSPDGRNHPPHLRPWRDGWRTLTLLLLYNPRWMFLYPGLVLMAIGTISGTLLIIGPRSVGGVTFAFHTLVYSGFALLMGFQSVLFSILAKKFAIEEGLLPERVKLGRYPRWFSLERGVISGTIVFLLGLFGSVYAVVDWGARSFGNLDPELTLRIVIPSVTAMFLGVQMVFASFFLSVLGLRRQFR
jgi:glycosyltransferase involved in cell wall biosynthesis